MWVLPQVSLEVPAVPTDTLPTACERPRNRGQLSCVLNPQTLRPSRGRSLKSLNIVVICYTAADNGYRDVIVKENNWQKNNLPSNPVQTLEEQRLFLTDTQAPSGAVPTPLPIPELHPSCGHQASGVRGSS